MLKLTTAGESHGRALTAIIEGLPSNLKVEKEEIDYYLALRQSGYGRGARQKIESDRAEIVSGVRDKLTLGSPVCIVVENKDYKNWEEYMSPYGADVSKRRLTKVRPGHADLTGLFKYDQTDARNILERASAREPAVRVAAGTIARMFLRELGVEVAGYVRSVESVSDEKEYTFDEIRAAKASELFMPDRELCERAKKRIDEIKEAKDTAGGVIELHVKGIDYVKRFLKVWDGKFIEFGQLIGLKILNLKKIDYLQRLKLRLKAVKMGALIQMNINNK